MRPFQRSISPTSCGGRSSTAAAAAPPSGRASAAKVEHMMALSLHTARRARLSTSSGAVQRPLNSGLSKSYTCLRRGGAGGREGGGERVWAGGWVEGCDAQGCS